MLVSFAVFQSRDEIIIFVMISGVETVVGQEKRGITELGEANFRCSTSLSGSNYLLYVSAKSIETLSFLIPRLTCPTTISIPNIIAKLIIGQRYNVYFVNIRPTVKLKQHS